MASIAPRSSAMVDALLGGGYGRAQHLYGRAMAAPKPTIASGLLNFGAAMMARNRMRGAEEAAAEREAALRGATGEAIGTYLGDAGGDNAALIQALTGAGHGGADALRLAAAAQGLRPQEPEPAKPTPLQSNVSFLVQSGAAQSVNEALGMLGKGKRRAPGVVGEYNAALEADLIPEGYTLKQFVTDKRAQTTVTTNVGGPATFKVPSNYMLKDPNDPSKGVMPIPGGPATEFSEAQNRAVVAAQQGARAIGILGQPGEGGEPIFNELASAVEAVKGGLPWIGNFLVSGDFQRAKNAMDTAVSAFLRLETGAAAPNFERIDALKRLAPVPGDKPEQIAQKWEGLQRYSNIAVKLSGTGYEISFGDQAPAPAPAPALPARTGTHAAAAARGGGVAPAVPGGAHAGAVGGATAPPDFSAMPQEQLDAVDIEQLDASQLEQWLNAVVRPAGASGVTGAETPAPGFAWEQPAPATAAAAPGRSLPRWTPTPGPAVTGAAPEAEVGAMLRTRAPGMGRAGGPGVGPDLVRRAEGTGRAGGPLGAPGVGADLVRRAEGTGRAGGPGMGADLVRRAAGTGRTGGPGVGADVTGMPTPEGRAEMERSALNVRALVSRARVIPADVKGEVDAAVQEGRYADALRWLESRVALDRDRDAWDAAQRLRMLVDMGGYFGAGG